MVLGSKTDTPKYVVGVPVLKLLRQWPIGVLAPPMLSMSGEGYAPTVVCVFVCFRVCKRDNAVTTPIQVCACV